MRQLDEVIRKMLDVIPFDAEELRITLENQLGSVIVSAPELMPLRWREVSLELEDYFCQLPLP